MSTMTANRPHFHCYDVVLPLGAGDSHFEMVDDLRRTAWRRFAEERKSRIAGWLRSPNSES